MIIGVGCGASGGGGGSVVAVGWELGKAVSAEPEVAVGWSGMESGAAKVGVGVSGTRVGEKDTEVSGVNVGVGASEA